MGNGAWTVELIPATGWETRLDNLWFWVIVAIILIVMAYRPFFLTYLPPDLVSPGFKSF